MYIICKLKSAFDFDNIWSKLKRLHMINQRDKYGRFSLNL